jgi:hypothetical protein
MFLKNKHLQIKLTPDADPTTGMVELTPAGVTEITEIIADAAMKTIAVTGGVIVANRVIKTICEVAIIAAKAKIK